MNKSENLLVSNVQICSSSVLMSSSFAPSGLIEIPACVGIPGSDVIDEHDEGLKLQKIECRMVAKVWCRMGVYNMFTHLALSYCSTGTFPRTIDITSWDTQVQEFLLIQGDVHCVFLQQCPIN